jgi:hypothetical protein
MSQPDFASLAVQVEQSDASLGDNDTGVSGHSVNKRKAVLQHVEDTSSIQMDGLYKRIVFEEPSIPSSNRMELDAVPVYQDMFEPSRRLQEFSPPKRFYRTFWRSAASRILALSLSQTM